MASTREKERIPHAQRGVTGREIKATAQKGKEEKGEISKRFFFVSSLREPSTAHTTQSAEKPLASGTRMGLCMLGSGTVGRTTYPHVLHLMHGSGLLGGHHDVVLRSSNNQRQTTLCDHGANEIKP
jgi:hypothetical protein